MSNWIKIGVPILVAALLIVSAVSITVAVTKDNAPGLTAAAYYTTPKTVTTQYSTGATCQDCPNYENCPNDGNCTGNCGGNSTCSGSCIRGSANAQTPPCQGTGYGYRSDTGTFRGGCGSCQTD